MQIYQYAIYTAITDRFGRVMASGVHNVTRTGNNAYTALYDAKAQAFATARREADALGAIYGERMDVIIDASPV